MENVMPGTAPKIRRKPSRDGRQSVSKVPMPHVISLRVNDREKKLLDQVSRNKRKNLSAVVREALEFWLAR
jgi:hypothetical protein